jgi:hypothetical protein
MFKLKIFLLILVFTIISSDTIQFNKCDPQWANDPLFLDILAEPRNLTICNCGGEMGEDVTLLAIGLANRGLTCLEFGDCNPKTLNLLIFKSLYDRTDFDDLLSQLGLSDFHHQIKPEDVQTYINLNYMLWAKMIFDKEKQNDPQGLRFYLTGLDDENVYGTDINGDTVATPINLIEYYTGFAVKSEIEREILKIEREFLKIFDD